MLHALKSAPVAILLVIAHSFTLSPHASAEAPIANKVCPLSGNAVDAKQWTFTEGKRVGFCCAKCKGNFTKLRENRLSEGEQQEGWVLGFNGKDLTGFQKPTRDGKWSVEGGVLTGTGGKGVLATTANYDDFTLQLDARISDKGERRGNSGIFIRGTGLTAYRGRWPDGPEIQIDHGDGNFWTGAIWQKAKAKKVSTKDGEWFQMKIEAVGPSIRVWVNDELVTAHKQEGKILSGAIALQVHHQTDLVEFKNIKIRPLVEGHDEK